LVVAGYAGSVRGASIDYASYLHWVGGVGMNFEPFGIAISGAQAYVVGGSPDGLQVVDLTNPANPQVVGSVDTPWAGQGVAVSGAHAFVVDGLATGSRAAGEPTLTRDGTDDHGRRVAAGTYFVRVESSEGAATERVVLIR
jgi:hypothetical protein